MEEWTHQSGTFDCHSELHGYGKRVLPNGVVERGQFVHGSLKNAVAEIAIPTCMSLTVPLCQVTSIHERRDFNRRPTTQ